MPRMKPDDVTEFLAQPHIGVLATLRQDGRPYTVPVWFLHHDEAFWITGTYDRVWCKQLFHDPRASLCVEATAPVPGHVGIDGTVTAHELPDFDIWPISRQLVDKYIVAAQREAFFANMRTEHRLLFRLTADVSRAIDMRIYQGKRADRDFQRRRPASDDAVSDDIDLGRRSRSE
jgi:PPOX class probable F420-dependent enzyme